MALKSSNCEFLARAVLQFEKLMYDVYDLEYKIGGLHMSSVAATSSVPAISRGWGASVPESPLRADQRSEIVTQIVQILDAKDKAQNKVIPLFDALKKIPDTMDPELIQKIFRYAFKLCKTAQVSNPNGFMISHLAWYYRNKQQHLANAILANKPELRSSGRREYNLLDVVFSHGSFAEIEKVIKRFINEVPEMTYQRFCDIHLPFNMRNLVERVDGEEITRAVFALLKEKNVDLSQAIENAEGAIYCKTPNTLRLLLNEITLQKRYTFLYEDSIGYRILTKLLEKSENITVDMVKSWIDVFEENGIKMCDLLIFQDGDKMTLVDHAAFYSSREVLQLFLSGANPEDLKEILENHLDRIGGILHPNCYIMGDSRGCYELIKETLEKQNS